MLTLGLFYLPADDSTNGAGELKALLPSDDAIG